MNMTQEQLGQLLGYGRDTINHWESGRWKPKKAIVLLLGLLTEIHYGNNFQKYRKINEKAK
jgi:DNA-binding transcriptional regulator YiaG